MFVYSFKIKLRIYIDYGLCKSLGSSLNSVLHFKILIDRIYKNTQKSDTFCFKDNFEEKALSCLHSHTVGIGKTQSQVCPTQREVTFLPRVHWGQLWLPLLKLWPGFPVPLESLCAFYSLYGEPIPVSPLFTFQSCLLSPLPPPVVSIHTYPPWCVARDCVLEAHEKFEPFNSALF